MSLINAHYRNNLPFTIDQNKSISHHHAHSFIHWGNSLHTTTKSGAHSQSSKNASTPFGLDLSIIADDLALLDSHIMASLGDKTLPITQEISNHIIQSGGKRIRPIVSLIASQCLESHSTSKTRLTLATIIEFIHTATLLHDDVVDHTQMRRGNLTAHKIWGNQASVLVGDYLFSRAFELISQLNHLSLMSILSSCTTKLAQGEILQLTKSGDLSTSQADYFNIISSKTAALFETAAQAGSLLSNAPLFLQNQLKQYGYHLGIAYQLKDDLLDFLGQEELMGKEVGNDYRENKVTLPMILAIKNTRGQPEGETLISILEDRKEASQKMAIDLITTYGDLEHVEHLVKDHALRALDFLQPIPETPFKDALAQLATFTYQRER